MQRNNDFSYSTTQQISLEAQNPTTIIQSLISKFSDKDNAANHLSEQTNSIIQQPQEFFINKQLIKRQQDLLSSDQQSEDNFKLQQLQKSQQQVVNVLNMIQQSHPIQRKNIRTDSLQHDIKLGWIPKTQVTGPIPISFGHQFIDRVIEQKISQNKVIYLGYRPCNSFEVHERFYEQGRKYAFFQFHLCKSQFLERFFKKYYKGYQFSSSRTLGMVESPPINEENSLKQDLIFDSYYQGGNLDAVYFQQQQYRLMIRVDSNTKGHCNYYNFKINCLRSGVYRFRIINMSKSKSLYERGMRPYIRIHEKKQRMEAQWQQGESPQCSKVKFTLSPLNELMEETNCGQFYCLKFQLQLKAETSYQLCYNIPYTYSDLIKTISALRQSKTLHVGKLGYSLSGVEIPLLTIAENQQKHKEQPQDKPQNNNANTNSKNNNYYVVITARIHPAESNSSHIVNGIIKFLLKQLPEFKKIKKNLVFKIIPMLNPDGVIIGNTRTGFAGKDLNRKFSTKTQFIFPEVNNLKDYLLKLKEKYGKNLLFLIDIHGHSTRKGSFFFGPQYPVLDQEYSKCRLLPKLYAARSEAFRYYSCKFRISEGKVATSRGFFNGNAIRTYTHQTSVHSFYDFGQRRDVAFTQKSLQNLGKDLALAIFDYVQKVIIFPKTLAIQFKSVAPKSEKQKLVEKQFLSEIIRDQLQQEQRESDKMPSDKADSESDDDDIQDKRLNVFYQKVNENREYFYEQVVKMLKNKKQQIRTPKKEKRNKLNQIQKEKKEKDKLLFKVNEKKKMKTNWSTKVSYTPKKTLFAEYTKMSLNIGKSSNYKASQSLIPKIKMGVGSGTQFSHRRNNSEKNSEQLMFGFQKVKLENHSNRIIYSVPHIRWEDSGSTSNIIQTVPSNQIYRYDLNDYSQTQLRKRKQQIKHGKMVSTYFIEKEQKHLKINKQLLQKLLVPSSNSLVNQQGKNDIKFSPLKDPKNKYNSTSDHFFPNTDFRVFAAFSQLKKTEDDQKNSDRMDKSKSQQGPQAQTKKQEYLCKKWEKQIVLKSKRNLSFGSRVQNTETKGEENSIKRNLVNLSNKGIKVEQKEFIKYGDKKISLSDKKESLPSIHLNRGDVVVIRQ